MYEPAFLMRPPSSPERFYLMRKEWHKMSNKVLVWDQPHYEATRGWATWRPDQLQLPFDYFIGSRR